MSQADEPRTKDQELKEKMRIQILIPIVLGALITSTVISFIIYYSAPRWIPKVQDSSLEIEGQNLKSLATSAGFVVQVFLQKIASDMLMLDGVLSQAVKGDLTLSSDATSDSTYFVGLKEISLNKDDIMSKILDFDKTANTSLTRSGWFVVGPQDSVNTYNDGGWNAVPTRYQDFYNQWLTLLPNIFALSDPKIYLSFYGPYVKNEGTGLGLYYRYPLVAHYATFVKYESIKGDETYFTFQTRPYYVQVVQSGIPEHMVQFTYPYQFVTLDDLGYTACVNTVIKTDERILLCVDYLADTIQDYIQTAADQKKASYFIIEKTTTKIIMFPNFTKLEDETSPNITQVEFNQTVLNTQEALDFDVKFSSFLASFDQENHFTMDYNKSGVQYILSLYLFTINVSNDPNIATMEYAVGLTIPLTDLQAEFEGLAENVKKPILIQIIILAFVLVGLFLFAHITIGWVSKVITAPITKLVQLLRKIENSDDGDEEDKEAKKSRRLELILRIIPNIESLSSELAELHKSFTLLKMSSQYTKEAETALNDGDAIIKYSQALNIHKIMGNKRNIGIVYNNIANIHFKYGNYQEANRFYDQAFEISEQELKDFEDFVKNRKKVSDESSVARVLKRSSSSNMFSTDVIDKAKAELEELHSNRIYYLAQTMFALAQKEGYNKQNSVSKIKNLLTDVVEYDNKGRRNPYRVILCLLDIAEIDIGTRDYKGTENVMQEVHNRLKIYEEETLQGYEDELSQDYKIPSVILRQKYFCTLGKLHLKQGKDREACVQFTKAIEHGKVYDPVIRRECLKHLENVFAQHNLLNKAPNIQKMMYTSSKRDKDLVILLDYSQSMGEGKRINFAISNILKLLDKYIQPNDRVSFVRFNMNCDVVFSLVEKKKNVSFLRKNIEDSLKPNGGTALYNAIFEGLKIMSKAEPKNNAKWIVALTDGDDNESRIRIDQLYNKLAKSDVNLIIVGLELHELVKSKLSYLCRVTSNGLFIESTSNEDINTAFQVVADVIFGSNLHVEKIQI